MAGAYLGAQLARAAAEAGVVEAGSAAAKKVFWIVAGGGAVIGGIAG